MYPYQSKLDDFSDVHLIYIIIAMAQNISFISQWSWKVMKCVMLKESGTIHCLRCVDNLHWFQFVGSSIFIVTDRQELISFDTHAHFQLPYFATRKQK